MYTLALHAAAARDVCTTERLYATPVGAFDLCITECVCRMTVGICRTMQFTAVCGQAAAYPAGGLLAGCLQRAWTDTNMTD